MMNSGPLQGPAHEGAAQAAAPSAAALLKLEDFLPHRLNVLSSLVSQALTRVYGAKELARELVTGRRGG